MMMKANSTISITKRALALLTLVLTLGTSCSGSAHIILEEPEQKTPPSLISKTEEGLIRWQLPFYGKVWLEGPFVIDGETLCFQPQTAHAFWNWNDGWTELDFVVEGELLFYRGNNSWIYRGGPAPQLIDISKAAIRYKNTILRGEEARREALNRQNRIRALSKLIQEELPSRPIQRLHPAHFGKKENFEQLIGKRWFPEVKGADESWRDFDFKKNGFIRGHGIRWSISATDVLLPKELHELRTSGTLFRDYEEGLEWLYLEWLWDTYFSNNTSEHVFIESGDITFLSEESK